MFLGEATTLFNEISQVGCETAAEDWLMRNDAEFLLAFVRETARLRDIVRKELSEHENVHVHLNIW
ncbi:hypothetical protein DIPPA_10506 [Diplonema papillatum]|nr:hypothetical protein DIPPA_10506 [Diplonema papillatum]